MCVCLCDGISNLEMLLHLNNMDVKFNLLSDLFIMFLGLLTIKFVSFSFLCSLYFNSILVVY